MKIKISEESAEESIEIKVLKEMKIRQIGLIKISSRKY